MRKLFLTVAVVLAAFLYISSAVAQKPPTKEEMLKDLATLSNSKVREETDKAYAIAKDYLARFGKDSDTNTAKVKTYFEAYRLNQFYIRIDGKKYDEAFAIGKEILAEQPENIEVLINLAYAGYASSGTPSGATYANDAVTYSRKSTQLIDAGKTATSFAPFVDKNDAMAYMYFIDGSLSMAKDPATAAGNIYKATQFESQIKTDPAAYYMIATYYEDIYAKLSAEAKKDQTRINAAIDLMMDAYARTCKRGEATKHPNYAAWKARFDQVYKFRKGSDAGLAEYITNTNNSPMPDPSKF